MTSHPLARQPISGYYYACDCVYRLQASGPSAALASVDSQDSELVVVSASPRPAASAVRAAIASTRRASAEGWRAPQPSRRSPTSPVSSAPKREPTSSTKGIQSVSRLLQTPVYSLILFFSSYTFSLTVIIATGNQLDGLSLLEACQM